MSGFIRKGKIVVIGDEPFVKGFMMAGARKGLVVDTTAPERIAKEVKSFVMRAMSVYGASVFVVHDSLRPILERLELGSSPLIIYLPDLRTVGKMDVRKYYSELIRKYLGISLEV